MSTKSPVIPDERLSEQPVFENPQAILMNAPMGIYTTTPEGRIISANPAMARMFGYQSPEDLIESITDIALQLYVDASDRKELMHLIEKQGEVINQECRMRRRDGSIFWTSRNAREMRDVHGNILHYQCYLTDITERKRAEEALHQSEIRFKAIFEESPVSIIVFDKDTGQIVDANEAAYKSHGFSSLEELRFSTVWPDPPYSVEDAQSWIRKAVTRGTQLFEWKNFRVTGETFWEQVYLRTIMINNVQRVLATSIDITGLKHAEQALQESEEKLRALFSAMNEMVVLHELVFDDSGNAVNYRVLDCNQAFTNITGIPKNEVLGKLATEVYPRGEPPYLDTYSKVALSGRPKEFIIHDQVMDKHFYISVVSPKKNHFATVTTDMTKLKLAEQEREKLQGQLLQAQKMKAIGILAGGVAHDFNNLLQTISGYLEMLLQDKSAEHPDYSRLQNASLSVRRAAKFVQQLLLVGRKVKFKKVRVDLNDELRKMCDLLERVIPKMIAIELHLDPHIRPIAAETAQIEQVLINLANNAVDAMPHGGRLEFKTGNVVLDKEFVRMHPGASPGPHILLSVTDTGCGIDSETREYIFDPFFTTKETGKGSGLGLASVYGIVNEHGGYIQCYSQPGQGTTFEIFLPAQKSDMLQCEKLDPAQHVQGGKESILVVEDEPEIQELMLEALKLLGYESKAISRGEEALEMYKNYGRDIDLVLLDLNMPGIGGHKCLAELLRLDPRVKVIIVSGYGADAQDVLYSGAKGYISKPYQVHELAAKIREVLDAD